MKKHIHRLHILILIGLVFTGLFLIILNKTIEEQFSKSTITFGVSFSPRYTEDLGLDPKQTYHSILQDLKAKHLRIPAYWDEIESQKDNFYFDDLDYYVNTASKNNVSVILAIGHKLPRWPECRAPSWLNHPRHPQLGYQGSILRERQLTMLTAVVEYYENNPTISAFQLENEPLLNFGVCPPIDRKFLEEEIAHVRKLTKKPIILTDSGELRLWKTSMELSDIFGTTLYRVVETPIIGSFYYPVRPWFYRVKSDLVRNIFAQNNQKTIISELQAESWARKPLPEVPIDQQINQFSLNQFKQTIDFARKTGFSEAYLWGVEWWYYLADQGHPEYLEFAKSLF